MKLAFTFVAAFAFLLQAAGQSKTSFEVYGYPERFGPKTIQYFKANEFKYANLLTHSSIYDTDPNVFSPTKIDKFLDKKYPDVDASETLVIDWETELFDHLKDYPATNSTFKDAEAQFIGLVKHIKGRRPNLKVGIYGIPFKGWTSTQIAKGNSPGKYDKILKETDFIAPSLYVVYADEEVGHNRNIQYLKDNLSVALDYGGRLHKPVIPFIWQKVHDYNKTYGREIIQKETFVEYVKCIATFSHDSFKVSGVIWWDEYKDSNRLGDLSGIKNHLEGKLIGSNSYDNYDNLMLDYTMGLVQMLQVTRPAYLPSSTSRKTSL